MKVDAILDWNVDIMSFVTMRRQHSWNASAWLHITPYDGTRFIGLYWYASRLCTIFGPNPILQCT